MQSPWAKAAAVLIGVFLLLFAVAMLMEGSGFVQSARNNALAYIIGLVGLGLIAAAFFGDTLKFDGDGKGPLGKVIATGGAAVFVIGLVFITSVSNEGPRAPEPAPSPIPSPGPTLSPGPALVDRTGGSGGVSPDPTATPVGYSDRPAAEPVQPAPPPSLFEDNTPDPELLGQGYHFAWTYCSACCPEGPDACPHTSWGIGANAEQAATTAILYCAGSGGSEQSCRANVEVLSEDELLF